MLSQNLSTSKNGPEQPSDELTVLVFKDNSSARTFKVSLAWISRVGFIIGAVTAVAILGLFLSTRFYFTARQASKSGDPAYVQALETENSSLKATLKQAQSQASAQATSLPPAQVVAMQSTATPAPTVTVTVTPSATSVSMPPVANSGQKSVGIAGPGFTAFPSSITPELSSAAISLYEPKVKWSGKTLKVQFFIQYNKEDKGNQQGRIILIARGPQTLMSYPTDLFNPAESDSLINPEKGEYFSVSRIREVKADFGPAKTNRDFTSVEVFLLSSDQKLLVHEVLKAPEPPAAPVHTPKAATEETPDDAPTSSAVQPLTPPTDSSAPAPTTPGATLPGASAPTTVPAPVTPDASAPAGGPSP